MASAELVTLAPSSTSDSDHQDAYEREPHLATANERNESEDIYSMGIQATLSAADWRIPSSDHEGSFIKLLRHFYFPIYVKYHKLICGAWFAVFILCIVYGPAFLSSTRSNLDLPAGTPSAAAVQAFKDNYPTASR